MRFEFKLKMEFTETLKRTVIRQGMSFVGYFVLAAIALLSNHENAETNFIFLLLFGVLAHALYTIVKVIQDRKSRAYNKWQIWDLLMIPGIIGVFALIVNLIE